MRQWITGAAVVGVVAMASLAWGQIGIVSGASAGPGPAATTGPAPGAPVRVMVGGGAWQAVPQQRQPEPGERGERGERGDRGEGRGIIRDAPGGPSIRDAIAPGTVIQLGEDGREGGFMFAPKMVKASYLGVVAHPADPTLRKQLSLPDGVGLVVEHVETGSPADQAKVEKHDVLQKLDDQLLINPEQLMVLVRMHKAGDEIKLTVIRQAKPVTLTAKLVEKEVPEMGDRPMGMDFMNPGRMPMNMRMGAPAMPGQMMPQGGMPGMPGGMPGAAPGAPMMNPRPSTTNRAVGGGAEFRFNLGGANAVLGQMAFSDGTHTLLLSVGTDGKTLEVKDKDGKVIFNGPVNTPEQRKALPEGVAPKLETLEKSSKVNIQVVPGAPGAGVGGVMQLQLQETVENKD